MGERWGVWIKQPNGEYWMLEENLPIRTWWRTQEHAECQAKLLQLESPTWRYEARRLPDDTKDDKETGR